MAIDNFRLVPSEIERGQEPDDYRDLADRISEAVKKSRDYFIHEQYPDGYWWFELESNVTITAEYLMLLTFVGIEDRERNAKIANHILKHQEPDGTWAIHKGGKGDVSTTVEAYFALKLAGCPAGDPRLEGARRFIAAHGGVENARFFTKIFLALFGQYDWRAIPSVPVEIVLLPHWFPLNIYNFSSWARATFVPLSVVLDAKPVKAIPENQGVRELYNVCAIEGSPTRAERALSWKHFFILLDRLVKMTEKSRLRSLRKKGLERAMIWILEHQEETGDWGGIQPAQINSILALLCRGHDISSEPIQKGLKALAACTIEREDELVLQSCISPVWDTALTALALSCSGLEQDHRALASACHWLAAKQIFKAGDWTVKRPGLEPGGWAFEFINTWYPDVDDTAVVLILLNNCGLRRFIKPENHEKAVAWVLGMQGKDGGWGAFDADNNMEVLNQIPSGTWRQ